MPKHNQSLRQMAAVLLAFGLIASVQVVLAAADPIVLHVAPTGDDAADGTRAKPVASPPAQAEYVAGSNIPIQFTAADPDGTIEDLRLSVYSWTFSREIRFEGPTGSYVLTNAPAGYYNIYIRASDDSGVSAYDWRTITVRP